MDKAPTESKLSSKDVFSYAVYGTFQNFGIWIPFLFLNTFMTTYLGFSAALMGTVLLVAKLCDFICSMLAGGIIESVHFKKGRYRPWFKILRWLIIFGGIAQVTNTSALPMALRVVVLIIGYICMHGSMNFMVTAQYGILASMAGANMEDRFRLTKRASQVNAAGSIILNFSAVPFCMLMGKVLGNAASGYTAVAAIFGCLLFIGTVLITKAAEPFDMPRDPNIPVKKVKVSDMVQAIFTNDQMIVYMLYQIINMTGTYVVSGMMMYYWMIIMNQYAMYSVSAGLTTCLGFVWAMFVPNIGKKLGKKKSLIVATLFALASKVFMYLFALKSIWFMTAINAFASAGMYLTMGFGINYYLDIGEYGCYKTGKDFRVLSMSMSNIPMKVSMALGGALSGYALAFIGFDKINADFIAGTLDRSTEVFTTFAQKYILVYSFAPAIFTIVALVLFFVGYKITDEDAKMYARVNAERKAAEMAAAAENK